MLGVQKHEYNKRADNYVFLSSRFGVVPLFCTCTGIYCVLLLIFDECHDHQMSLVPRHQSGRRANGLYKREREIVLDQYRGKMAKLILLTGKYRFETPFLSCKKTRSGIFILFHKCMGCNRNTLKRGICSCVKKNQEDCFISRRCLSFSK